MKILFTATVQSHICQFHLPLIKMLKEQGHEIHVAAKDNLDAKPGLHLSHVDQVFDVPFSRSPFSAQNIKAYKLLKKILKENAYDVIHCNTPMGSVVTRLASRAKNTKIIYTAHGFHFYKGAPLKNWLLYFPVEWLLSFTLLRNGKALRKASLSAANSWKHTFTKLPNSGTYTVEETAVSGYTTDYIATEDGFVITNRHESDTDSKTIQVVVQKVWADADNRDGKRPRSVTVQLVQDGTVVQTAVCSADNNWQTSFSGLDAEKSYSVREITVAGYTASYSGNAEDGFVITNRYAASTTEPTPGVTTDPDVPTPPVTTEPVPSQPKDPDIPQTGANTFPMYILLAIGVLLVLLGVADLLCKRVKK